jgi:hypothetical protein
MSKVTFENFIAFVKDQPKGEYINHHGWDDCAVGRFLGSVKSKTKPDRAIRQILGLPYLKGTQPVVFVGDDNDWGGPLAIKRSRTKEENLYIQLERGAQFPVIGTYGKLAKKLDALAA